MMHRRWHSSHRPLASSDVFSFKITGGKGGDGCVSFLREKFRPFGPPDGGNGGKGGKVVIQADRAMSPSLHHLRKHYRALDGASGKGKQKHGRNAEDLVLRVPIGTRVQYKRLQAGNRINVDEGWDAYVKQRYRLYSHWEDRGEIQLFEREYGESLFHKRHQSLEEEETLLVELEEDGASVVVAAGGKGGFGNPHFCTRKNAAPKFCYRGMEGDVVHVQAELRMLADVALIGLPNAGKSSLLRALSRARPKVAAYPFTTLEPSLGVLEHSRIVVADVPGLVRGAGTANKGLGHAFLRHVERCRVFAMVVDIGESETAYGVGPVEAFELLCTELREYARLREQETLFNQLMDKMILVGNKADVPGAREHWQQLEQHLSITNNPVKRLAVSAQQEKNLDALVEMLTVS